MIKIIQDINHAIFTEKEGPLVSIYQKTHKTPREVQHDMLAFKNHLKTVRSLLEKMSDEKMINQLLEPLQKLQEDKTFWNNNTEGIAIFTSLNDCVTIRLNKEVKDKVVVADSFHTKPLLRHFQTRGTFDVLTLNRERFALYTCTQDTCHKVAFEEGTPLTKEDVLGSLDEEKYLSHASYNGTSNQAMYHGHDDSKSVIEKDTERFFRYVDQFIKSTYSKPTKRPLILWSLPEHHSVFRKLSKNAYLYEDGIKQSDKDLTEDKVLEKAWKVIEPRFKKELKNVVDRYNQARANNLASNNIHEIAEKVIQANIEVLMIASNQSIPGKLDKVTGAIIEAKSSDLMIDDVLDDLAEYTLTQGGQVIVLDDGDMPTEKSVAAIFRY